jgi:hypothetical protein
VSFCYTLSSFVSIHVFIFLSFYPNFTYNKFIGGGFIKKLTEYGVVWHNSDYYRTDILQLGEDTSREAFIITCKYIHSDDHKLATFGNIKIFDETEGHKTKYQLTNHVNFPRQFVERHVTLSQAENHLKFFALCIPSCYNHFGDLRGGLTLLSGYDIPPISRAPEKKWLWDELLSKYVVARNNHNNLLNKS